MASRPAGGRTRPGTRGVASRDIRRAGFADELAVPLSTGVAAEGIGRITGLVGRGEPGAGAWFCRE
ncbi:hypothetical protein SHO565_69250 [Streptomyces sp. HO565]